MRECEGRSLGVREAVGYRNIVASKTIKMRRIYHKAKRFYSSIPAVKYTFPLRFVDKETDKTGL